MKKIIFIITGLLFVCGLLFSQDPSGSALSFNGVDDYVDCGNDASVNMNNRLTLEAWINSATLGSGKIISKWGMSSGYELAIITLAPDYDRDVVLNLNQLYVLKYSLAGLEGKWIHLAATWNGSNAKLYVNGNLATNANFTDAIVNSTRNLTIGRMSNLAPSTFEGLIDEVRVWRRARSQFQIQSTMNDTLGSRYYSGKDSLLVAYWRFDESKGDTIFDLTSYHNDGIIKGATFVPSEALTGVEEYVKEIPKTYFLSQNYPNPFNSSTKIPYSLPNPGYVTLKIYDILGREIETVFDEYQIAGTYSFNFDAGKLSSGIYFYVLKVEDDFKETKKMLFLP
jgi:hypothetical protein